MSTNEEELDAVISATDYTYCFIELLKVDAVAALQNFTRLSLGILACLEGEGRTKFTEFLVQELNGLGNEVFEDGADITSFINERWEDHA